MAPTPLCQISVTPSVTHNQTGPIWCCFPSGLACARSRSLCVSPTSSPVRLEVSPAAASTPTGVFNQRFEALFPCTGALGCMVCFSPPSFLPVYLCENVGLQGPPATTLWGLLAAACPAPLHNPPPLWVRQPPPGCGSSLPPLPVSTPPMCLDECFFLSFFLKKFLLLLNYSCMPFLPIPPLHPSRTHLPPPPPPSVLILSMCPL